MALDRCLFKSCVELVPVTEIILVETPAWSHTTRQAAGGTKNSRTTLWTKTLRHDSKTYGEHHSVGR